MKFEHSHRSGNRDQMNNKQIQDVMYPHKRYAPFKCQTFKKAEKEPLSAKICSSLKYFLSGKTSVSRNWSFKFILSFSSIYTAALRKMRQRKYPKRICITCILFCSTFTLTFAENILPIKNCTNKKLMKIFFTPQGK